MNLSEYLDEIKEIEIYEVDPSDWMGYLGNDDYWIPEDKLIQQL